ncbi:MAG: hypothetical protein ACR2RL_07980, partial [Gammaproteobacteria bacterium]
MGKLYKIAFKGEVDDGFTVDTVKASFAERFRKGQDVIDRLFSGNAITLVKNMELARATKAADQLRSFGAIVYLLDEQGESVDMPQSSSANDAVAVYPELKVVQTAPVRSSASETATGDETAYPYDLTATAKLRHLTQITDKRVTETPPVTNIRKTRLRYKFDSFMAKGGGSIFKVLTAVFVGTFLLIGLLRGVLLWVFPDVALQHEDVGFLGNLYITFLEITDPGNMAQDIYSAAAYKVFAVLAGIAGIIMLSALIA